MRGQSWGAAVIRCRRLVSRRAELRTTSMQQRVRREGPFNTPKQGGPLGIRGPRKGQRRSLSRAAGGAAAPSSGECAGRDDGKHSDDKEGREELRHSVRSEGSHGPAEEEWAALSLHW